MPAATDPKNPSVAQFVVTPSDTQPLAFNGTGGTVFTVTRALLLATAQNVQVQGQYNPPNSPQVLPLQAGFNSVCVTQVYATNTGTGAIVALY